MFFTMGVSLYTSRVVLRILGVDDFGIYNVVASVVVMFSFINNAMTLSTQRFLNYEMGKNNIIQLEKVFGVSVFIHSLFILLIVLFSETIGLWLVNTQLVIPDGRINAVNWVYQFSILNMLAIVFAVPFNAIIVAHEKMSLYAYLSILESVMKLAAVLLLQVYDGDKLILYAFLLFIITLVVRVVYIFYCKKCFLECNAFFCWDKVLFKKMFIFAGWNFLGSISSVISNQGVSILINIFLGPAVNAARSIAFQIQNAVISFVTSFMTAANPQIIKSYAQNDKEYMFNLISSTSKYSFLLLYIFSLPLLVETKYILYLWLGIIPTYTVLFTQLSIVYLFIYSFTYSLNMASQATGRISHFQILDGLLLLFVLPISYVLLKNNCSVYLIYIELVLFMFVILIGKLFLLKRQLNFPVRKYGGDVLLRSFIVFVFSYSISSGLKMMIMKYFSFNIFVFFAEIVAILLITSLTIVVVGLKKPERTIILNRLKRLKLK